MTTERRWVLRLACVLCALCLGGALVNSSGNEEATTLLDSSIESLLAIEKQIKTYEQLIRDLQVTLTALQLDSKASAEELLRLKDSLENYKELVEQLRERSKKLLGISLKLKQSLEASHIINVVLGATSVVLGGILVVVAANGGK